MRSVKNLLIILIMLLILVSTMILIKPKESNLDYYTQTKAICNETNYCQDYYVSCNEEGVIRATPMTGAVTQQDSYWKDPRNETEKELCN